MTRTPSVRIVVGYALTVDERAAVVADLTWGDHARRLEAIVDAATQADACLAATRTTCPR
jgi:hypothetical protein